MPTREQFIELFVHTTPQLVLKDGTVINMDENASYPEMGSIKWQSFEPVGRTVKGVKFIGANSNELFFPITGFVMDNESFYVGDMGWYYTASLMSDNGVSVFNFYSSDATMLSGSRVAGDSIRGIVKGIPPFFIR